MVTYTRGRTNFLQTFFPAAGSPPSLRWRGAFARSAGEWSGYGDRYPVTTEGRLIAVALMLVGIALLGVVTAAVAAWFVGAVREQVDRD